MVNEGTGVRRTPAGANASWVCGRTLPGKRKTPTGIADFRRQSVPMREVLTGLAERRLTEVVQARLTEEPVVVLNGPRTAGKSTLLSPLAEHLGRTVIDCDDPATRSAASDDPLDSLNLSGHSR